jgi:hypothetical protein
VFSPKFSRWPVPTFARDQTGRLHIANGADPIRTWNGFESNFVDSGVPVPANTPTIVSSGSGTIIGTIYAYQRWLNADGLVSNLSPLSAVHAIATLTGTITAATNAAPVVITSTAHGLSTGNTAKVAGVQGNWSANGTWVVTVVDANSFSLNESVGSGAYKASGSWNSGATTITYTNCDAPSDPRVTTRQILRNKDGAVATFYIDVTSTNLTTTTFSSTTVESDLGDAVPLVDTNGGDLNVVRHGEPPGRKRVVIAHQTRLFFTSDAPYKQGAAIVTKGSTTVLGIGTYWTSVMVGWNFFAVGTNNTTVYTVQSVESHQQIQLTATWEGSTDPYLPYAVAPGSDESRTVYFSEAGLPQSVNVNGGGLTIPEDVDAGDIVGLLPLRNFVYILCESRTYRLTYQADPAMDGSVFPAYWRGAVNQQCWVTVEGSAYVMDRKGCYIFSGNQFEEISEPIQQLFGNRPNQKFKINWQDTEHFHAAHNPAEEVIKWFVCLEGLRYPKHALVYHYRHRRWYLEEYPVPIICSSLGDVDGRREVYYGTPGRRVLLAGKGTLDGIKTHDGTVHGTATSADYLSLSDTTAAFSSNAVNAPVQITEGTGKGQVRIISAVASTKLTMTQPWLTQPDDTSVYQIGGVRWRYRTGMLRFVESDKHEKRGVEVLWKPTENSATLISRLYHDRNSAATVAGLDRSSTQGDGIATTKDSADRIIDLTKTSGFAQQNFDSSRTIGVDGRRFLSIELEGITNDEQHRISQVAVYGVK